MGGRRGFFLRRSYRLCGEALTCCFLGLVGSGCGGSLEKISQSCALSAGPGLVNEVEIGQDVTLSLPTGFGKVLKKGSRWRPVGAVDLGTVYQPVNVAFTFPAQWQHEAYLIISENRLVGFYFPVEQRCVEMNPPVILPLR